MGKAGKLAAYEVLVARQRSESRTSPEDYLRPKDRVQRQPVMLQVTPMAAFAAGALAVSSLAFAFSLGRYYGLTQATEPPAAADSLEDVLRQKPISYKDLQVDRGQVP